MIAQNTDPMFKMAIQGQRVWLLDLPDEILITIMSFLDLGTLLKAKLVCKHFDDLTDQFVYQDPKILKGHQAVQLTNAFNKSALRLNWIKSLLVSTKFGEDSGLTRLPSRIRDMRNLEVLRLETPDCNSRQSDERFGWICLQDMYEAVFEQSSLLVTDPAQRKLPHLKECTLHFVDLNVELYSLTRYASIFLHPNLRSLTLSCTSTNLPNELRTALHYPDGLERSTELEHIFLEECDIHAPSLAYLLSFPRSLKSFKFSEGIRYDGLFRSGSRRLHGNVRPHHLMDALTESCSESLESLSLTLGYRRHPSQSIADPGQYLNMTKMARLKYVEVDNNTLALLRPRPQCDHKTWLRLPRTLETFKISNIHLSVQLPFETPREPHIPLEACIISEKAKHGVPNLRTVIFSYDFVDNDDDDDNDIDDFLHFGNGNLPFPTNFDNDNLAQAVPPAAQHAAANNHNDNNNAGVNLGATITGPRNAPIHPPQPPAATAGHIPAYLTNNLNIVNPGNLNQAQQFLRQHWFTHANRSRAPAPPMQWEFTHLEMSKIALLQILNNDLLPQYQQHNTRLIVDIVKLPTGFIPPYLFPEDKPTTYSSWWDSSKAKETESYKQEFRTARQARFIEHNLRRERERRPIEEEIRARQRRMRRRADLRRASMPFLTPARREAWLRAIGAHPAGVLEGNANGEINDENDDDEEDYDEEELDEEDLDYDDGDDDSIMEEEDELDEDDIAGPSLFMAEGGIMVADDGIYESDEDHASDHGSDAGPDDASEVMHDDTGTSSVIDSLRATVGDESEEDTSFVDAPVSWPA